MKNLKKQLKRISLFALLMISATTYATGSTAAISAIGSWQVAIKDIFNAAVAVFGIVGGFIIFVQYMQGNEQAQKNFIKFVIGLAIFGIISYIVQVFLS